MPKDHDDQIIGGVNLGGLTDYLFVFTNGSQDANWQGATKGFVGDVAVDGLQAAERTSGGVPFAGTIYTNDTTAGAWQGIADQNAGTAGVSTGETELVSSLEADLASAFDQIDALSATSGYESVDASDLDGLNTENGIAETFVINVTSGFNVDYTIDITGDAEDVYILRWDEDADPTNGYQGTVKFQSGGGINPLGDLSPSNFINVAGDINASGGGSTPSGLVDDVSELDGVSGGGFFTGYWLTTGDPTSGDTQSLSNAIFTGGWYTSSDKFSLTSGTSGVYVAPTTDPGDPTDPTDPDCITVLENTSPIIADLDCGDGDNPDMGKDICAVIHKEMNGFNEDTEKPSSYTLTLGDELTSEINSTQGDKLEVGTVQPGDDGDGSYYVVVTRESDSTKTSNQFFAGTVASGESFTASEAAFGTSFGSETYVHIYSSEGGTLLQTINFHTSCSAPLVIGEQYGSISLAGAAVEGKDSGTIYQIGQTETDGDEGVIYEITGGNDADDFTVDSETGEVTFLNPPDFENPTDSDGDNKYDVEVTAFFVDQDRNKVLDAEGQPTVCDVKTLEVCVEDDCITVLENTSPIIADLDCGDGDNPDMGKDICAVIHKEMNGFNEDTEKPSSYTLTLGDELTSEINSTQGDKLEVGTVQPGDDGDGSYYVVVTRESDSTKTSNQFFAGTVASGESFTASEAAFGTSFGSETYVHIYSSEGGTLLQTINFHTSCSAPLVIGEQYGSISLAGAAVEGKDSGTIYQIGQAETDGDEGVIYEITGGNDADDFTVDSETGEVTFLNPPDFENPTDSDGDNKYDVEVTAFFVDQDRNKVLDAEGQPTVCDVKTLEVCVEDDCITVLENTSPIIADLDCGDGDNPDMGKDICAVIHKEMNGFNEDTEKPSSYTLTLGDELTSEINSTQGDKLEVGTVQPGDDGDGSYYVVVTRESDSTKTSNQFFAGTVASGESFTASEAAFGTSFGSETYVHIYSSEGGALLQTINFHTSCSAPLVIGEQYGSISLAGAAVEGKDSGTIYQIGQAETDGDEGVIYEITGGNDADDFTVDSETGEVTFLNPPDFENPTDSDGDNKYDVEVTAFFVDSDGVKTGEVCDVKTLEVCVEDQDCIEINENTTGPVTDLDATVECEVEAPGGDMGLFVCQAIDAQGLEKPSELTLTLGDMIDPKVSDFQPDGKSSVATTGASEDGDGLLRVIVSNDDDPTKLDTVYFDGSVSFGQSFTALASNAGDNGFSSNTYVHILDDDGTLLQTIQYHTSCSAPIVIGDQVGSVTVTGVGALNKDTGQIVSFGGTTMKQMTLGEGDIVYSIVGGDDAGAFTVDPDTGEVSFINSPDFEASSVDGDDNYEVIVRATAKDDPDCFTDTPVEICVKDVVELGSLSGRYFCDTNDNDIDDNNGDEPGIASVLVLLRDPADNSEIARTFTADDGTYSFDGLEPGTYRVVFRDPNGVLDGKQLVNQNDPDGNGDDTNDSDARGDTDRSVINGIEVVAGQDTPDNDVGAEYTAALGDRVFLDADRDGIQDPGEAGVADVTVTLTGGGADGVIGTPDDNTTDVQVTDANGNYLFEDLDPGTEYKVTFSDLPAGTEFTAADQGGDDALDSDADPANGMTGIYTLAPGEVNLTADAGIVSLLGSISGRYFCDTNDNDVDDGEATDPGEAGVLVTLFDAAGNAVATTTTGSQGLYSFTGLPAGTYSVQFTDPDSVLEGKQLVDPNVGGDDTIDSDAIGDTTTSTIGNIEVVAGQDTPDNDVGAEYTAALGDRVFLDADRDGIQDPGEAGVADVTVTLTGGGADGVIGTPDDNTTDVQVTDANGNYLFEDLDPGTEYKVTFSDLPAGTEFTAADQGGDDALDSDADPANGMTGIYTLAPGEVNLTADAGIVSLLGSISGRYFCDTNDNDVDDGEATDPGEAGVLVTLFDAAGNAVATTTTGSQGLYSFTGLPAGTYSVQFTDPDSVLEGKQLVDPNVGGDDTIDSDAIGDTTTSTIGNIEVVAGQDTPDNDVGAEYTAALGDRVFLDADRDGIQDPGEAGVADVTVTLTGGGADGVIGTPDDNTTDVQVTDANGNYLFEDLDPGTEYKVTFSDLPAGTEFTAADQGGDDALDSDADPANGMTGIYTLAPGEVNLTADAGIVSLLGSISGRYFCDTNDNDVDDGEATDPGEAGVLVTLFDAAGNAVATTTTGSQGLYSFTGLPAGTYSVQFTDPDSVLEGKQLVDPNVGGDDTIDSDAIGDTTTSTIGNIEVVAGQDTPDNDVGAEYTAALGDRVFLDADRDGIQDPGEAGVADVTVTLTGGGADGVIGTPDDNTTDVQVTDANGNYLFEDLDPGTEYKVTFSDLPAGTEFTAADQGGDDALDSDADPANGMTGIYTLAPGEVNLTADAGIVSLLGSISGRYFCDTNDNDVDDGEATDPGEAGVLVTLFDAAGNAVATTTTGSQGLYSFTGLPAGTYSVQFTDPDSVLEGKQLVDPNVGGDDTIDSDAIGDTTTSTIGNIEVVAGQDTPDNDVGAEYTAALGDRVFLDADRDGIQDPGEAGVADVTVTLTGGGADGVIGTPDDNTTDVQVTDANGNYLFEDLDPGTEYKVTFSDLPAGTEFTAADQGGDDALDSDADPANGMTPVVILAPGEENLTLDAGIVSQLGSLSGRYFCDENNNDLDDGEPGIEGVTVELLEPSGKGTGIFTTTGPNGFYSFTGLAAGVYGVLFTDTVSGKTLVASNVGDDDTIDSDAIDLGDGFSQILGIQVVAGQDTPDNDAGVELLDLPPDPAPDAGKGCADELITVENVLSNDSDPEGDTLTILAINGVAIGDGGTVQIDLDGAGGRDPISVTLLGDDFVFDGDAAYADLDIGEEETAQFTYTVSDGNGNEAVTTIDVTFCGDANSVASLGSSLPDGQLILQTLDEVWMNGTFTGTDELPIDASLPVTPNHEEWTIKVSGSGDIRFDGMIFDEAYCLEIFTPVLAGRGRGQTDIDSAPEETVTMHLLDDTFDFGTDKAAGLSDGQVAKAINWILNQDFNSDPDYTGVFTDGGLGQPVVTDAEIQAAVWKLTDNQLFLPSGRPDLGQLADAQKIFDLALANTDFQAGTNEKIGLVLDPVDGGQPFVFAIDFEEFDCLC